MRTLANLTEEERIQIAELEGLEAWVTNEKELTAELKAQQYVCLAHDWLDLKIEERAIYLFQKAAKTCPGFFPKISTQIAFKDQKFALILVRTAGLLINLEVEASALNQ